MIKNYYLFYLKIVFEYHNLKESSFVNQNKDKWKRFERRLHRPNDNPDELADLFIEVTDDLSYARTFYPNRSVRYYLNTLAQRVFYNIYKNRKIEWKKIPRFWIDEVPSIAFHTRKYLLYSFLIFLLAFTIGVFSSFHDPDFCEVIMGNEYVEMTKENIANGDPLGVYKKSKEIDMFLGITINNIRVSLITFLFGLFFGIGTIGILLNNGIMVGAFQYFFIKEGFGFLSFTTIWLHGALEISSIIIAGAAGMILGSGLIRPGSYSRIQSFKISAKLGLKLLLSVLPIFVVAGFIEGFFTRFTDASPYIKLFIITCSFGFILFYYLFYPWWLNKKGGIKPLKVERLESTAEQFIELHRIKPVSTILVQGLQVLKNQFRTIFSTSIIIIIGHASTLAFLYYNYFDKVEIYNLTVSNIFDYNAAHGPLLFALNSICLTILLHYIYKAFASNFKLSLEIDLKSSTLFLGVSTIVNGTLYLGLFGLCLILAFVIGYLIIVGALITMKIEYKERNIRNHIINVLRNNHGKLVLVGLFGGVLISVVCAATGTLFFLFLTDLVNWNVFDDQRFTYLLRLVFLDISVLILLTISICWVTKSWLLSYFSFRETNEANQLKMRIDELFA